MRKCIRCECEMRENYDVEGQLSVNRIAVIARNKYVFSHLEKELSNRNILFSFKKSSTGMS